MKAGRAGPPAAMAAQAGPALRLVLLYGPDGGLVHERARDWVIWAAGDAQDPFRVVEINASALKDDPARLADEAAAFSLTGGRRAVWLRDAGDVGSGPVIARYLEAPAGDALIVVEAGELPSRSALRKAAEAASAALAIACYHDSDRDLAGVIKDSLARDGLSATAEAVAFLTGHLGGDRMMTRSELEKLALSVLDRPGHRIELADVEAAIGDSAALSIDDLVQATANGSSAELDRVLARALAEGESAVGLTRVLLRHFQKLYGLAAGAADGRGVAEAIGQLRPPPFPRDRERLAAQLQRWQLNDLATACALLAETEIQCKTTGLPERAILSRILLRIATLPRRNRR